MEKVIVAGDVGGTHTRMGVFAAGSMQPVLIRSQVFASRDSATLVDIVEQFVGSAREMAEIFCFGISGPVDGGVAHPTNLPWVLDERQMAAALGARVMLINDLEANAYGVSMLAAGDVETLQEGEPGKHANAAVVSAGTGLGEAGLYWDGGEQRPFACEGGHASFAPENAQQIALLEFLAREFGHVSWERVLSGPGLHNIYRFLLETRKQESEEAWLTEHSALKTDPSAVIADAAVHNKSKLCEKALDLFRCLSMDRKPAIWR